MIHPESFQHHGHAAGPLCGSLSLFALAAKLWPAHGLDPATLAALAGAAGTLLIGCVNASREIRAWLDRRAAR